MSEENKLTHQEIEHQLSELLKLIVTEPNLPTSDGQFFSQIRKDLIKSTFRSCNHEGELILTIHHQKKYEYIRDIAVRLQNMEQGSFGAHPQLKSNIGHLRKMLNLINDDPQVTSLINNPKTVSVNDKPATGCMVALLIGCGLSYAIYWAIYLI
ncbi:hypothetical protein [Aureibaculum conchae]|uniref:hypothetical protein n=1 Tax=Aureibaculum sp. 2308TA14-22 TaxID=3108392 RepID=UPI003390F73E